MGKLKITYIHSAIGKPEKQLRIIRALGLRKLNQSVVHDDNKAIRGMVRKVPHLVHAEEVLDG